MNVDAEMWGQPVPPRRAGRQRMFSDDELRRFHAIVARGERKVKELAADVDMTTKSLRQHWNRLGLPLFKSQPRSHVDPAKIEALYLEFLDSGLSVTDFAKRDDVPLSARQMYRHFDRLEKEVMHEKDEDEVMAAIQRLADRCGFTGGTVWEMQISHVWRVAINGTRKVAQLRPAGLMPYDIQPLHAVVWHLGFVAADLHPEMGGPFEPCGMSNKEAFTQAVDRLLEKDGDNNE